MNTKVSPRQPREAKPAPLYEQLAGAVARQIERGAPGPGERLPSVRRLSTQHGVSLATAVQAYLRLEGRGLIEARPRSGFYVRSRRLDRVPEPRASSPGAGAAVIGLGDLRCRLLEIGHREDFVPFGLGSPSAELLPVEKLHRTLAAVARRGGREAISYDPPPGCPPLRRQLARRSLDWGCALAPEEFIITTGAMEALSLSLRAVCRPGDVVALESPTYFGVLQAIESLGLRALEIPTHPREGMDLDRLEDALRRRGRVAAVLATLNFNNPLGSRMPDAGKRRLVEMLARREIPLIEDDIYGDLHFGPGPRPRAAKAFDKRGLVLLCGSVSKTLAPGWRVGWVAPGERFSASVQRLRLGSTLAAPTLPPLAVADFWQTGGYDHHLRGIRATFERQVEQVSRAVAESFPPGIRLTRPQGGFVVWVELPPGVDALALHERALAERISLAPGPIFSAKPRNFRNFIRLSCSHPWSSRLERGIAVLAHLVKRMQKTPPSHEH